MLALSSSAQQTNHDFELGKASYNRSDWDGAITNFTKSIESSFDLHNSYSYRAYASAMKGDSNGAIADCNRLIAFEPNCGCGYYWRSRVELELTNNDAALRDFEIGIKMEPKDRPADLARRLSLICQRRAFKKYRAEDLDGAITNLNEAIYIAPTNSSPYALRGWLKLIQNHFDSAIADAFFAIKFEPRHLFAYDTRAWARYERGDVSGAVEDCMKVTEIWDQFRAKNPYLPLEPEDYTTSGLLCFINGDFGKAIENWNRFQNSNTNLPPPAQQFLQKWIKKAQAKLPEKKP